jgi:predicted deacetylase
MHWLDPLASALDAAPSPVRFFFRDDDAGWDDRRLLALLDVFAARALPVDVAVIPQALSPGLARELRARPARLHQHGFAHSDHEPEGRKCEFGPSRPAALQRADIAAGRARLADLLGDAVQPIFTPPWNRCTEATGRVLVELGFAVLSREHRAPALGVEGLLELPVRADWVRLEPDALALRLAEGAAAREPLGVMLHHAVMPAADLRRLDELLALVATHDGARAEPMAAVAGLSRECAATPAPPAGTA